MASCGPTMVVVIPLLFLLLATTADPRRHRRGYNVHIRAAVFLPSSITVDLRCRANGQSQCQEYLATLETVQPVLELAAQDMYNRSMFSNRDWLKLHLFEVDCRNQSQAAHSILKAKDYDNVLVVFGPICDYTVATIARISGHYQLPLLTPGAFSHSFEDKHEFPIMRLGLDHSSMSIVVDRFAKLFKWEQFVYSNQWNFDMSEVSSHDFCKLFGNTVYDRLGKTYTIQFKSLQRLDLDYLRQWLLEEIGTKFAVIVICGSPKIVRDIMLTAHDLGMTQSGEYIFVNIDVSVGSNATKPWHLEEDPPEKNEKAKEAFKAMKVISLRKSQRPDYGDFEKKVRESAEKTYNYSSKTGKPYELNHFLSAFYEAVLLYSIAVNETLSVGLNITNGTEITRRMWNRTFEGITGNVSINENGDRHIDYAMFDYNPESGQFEEKAYWSGAKDKWVEVGQWYWVGGKAPADSPVCGYDKSKCPKNDLPAWGWSLIALGLVTLAFATVSFFIHRHYKLEAELAAMTWRIRWEELSNPRKKSVKHDTYMPNVWNNTGKDFIDDGGILLKRVDSRTSLTKSVVSEETIANQEQIFTKTATYKGTMVAIKKLNIDRPKIEMNRAMLLELKKMKDLQHDNITRFVGACIDMPHACIVTEYCQKGSLEDILENEEIQLDKMMIYSLLHDVVKGMDYIHSLTDIRSHGNLKSSNCVVDSRFVVKITDFGLHQLRLLEDKSSESHDSHHHWKSKLWTAPELLRMDRPPLAGSPKGDVYSFSIILHEMAFRQGVFYLENETATPSDIVNRVMLHQQPPFRPSIDDSSADESLVQLMTKCWAENPMDRPDFSSIRKQVRELVKKFDTSTNIVDNLLKRMEQYATNLEGLVEERTAAYLEEKRKAENLLYQLLPQSVASELIQGKPVTAESFDCVTIYFSDIVGFTSMCSSSTPMQVVTLLGDLYSCFDTTIEHFDVYKVETIGDAYMVVSGLPRRNASRHACEIARMSLALLKNVSSFRIRHKPDEQLNLRIGIHSGPVCAGVVGLKMPRYCLFGDTVNTASRMESTGEALKIHVSKATKELLETFGCFQLTYRGLVEMKGKGMQETWWLTGECEPGPHAGIMEAPPEYASLPAVSASDAKFSSSVPNSL